jgi:hypothetical protein
MRLYHPNRKPPANEYVTESDDELHVQVYLDAGWLPAPEPEAPSPAHAPEPVSYAPVTKTKRATKTEASDK